MKSIIKFSDATLLALHSLGIIAKFKDKKMNTGDVAEMLNASRNHLAKIHQRLVKLGYIESTRGPGGGFIMKHDPDNIYILDIIEAFEGKIFLEECSLNLKDCPFKECMFDIQKKLFTELYSGLKSKKLSEII